MAAKVRLPATRAMLSFLVQSRQLLTLPIFAFAGIYYGYDYIPPAYPPPYYQISSYPKSIGPLYAKTDEFSDSNAVAMDTRVRVKRQVERYYYGGYPGYYNPIGTGFAWAAGGGLIGNTLSFLVG
ncbi:hypothetical protein Aduo_015164 [Ancylostoma duodenale]